MKHSVMQPAKHPIQHPVWRALRVAVLAIVVAGSIAACGRKGPIEPRPPESQSPVAPGVVMQA